jgi:metal-responsive CopG/Arc/MetJ family transcriptional regulator
MSTNASPVPRIALGLPGSLIDRVDRYAAKAGFASRSAAVRALIAAGLSLEPGPHQDPRVTEMHAKLQARSA